MTVRKLEKIAGENLTLNDIKEIIFDILPYITEGKIRLLIYNVFPGDDSTCVATDVSISYQNEISFKMKCINQKGYIHDAEAVGMDYFDYIIILTERLFPSEETEAYQSAKNIVDKLSKIIKNKNSVIKATLYLSPTSTELKITATSRDVVKVLNKWYNEWLLTGKYTPVFLFKTMVYAAKKSGIPISSTVFEKECNSFISLLY